MPTTAESYSHHLPPGHEELEYRFDRILGEGGFGVTYLATDTRISRHVAIKEYMPAEFAVRGGGYTVQPKSAADRETFDWGLKRFLQEARLLAQFDHPNIVQVQRFFEANGTAYMVMSYVEGQSLFDVMAHEGSLGERALKDILYPLLDGLRAVHRADFLHRDIKPENIFIRLDGSPVLLDFGAARQAVTGKTQQVTSIVTPGFAPPEQYEADGDQGPWTDIYALAGVLYTGVTGTAPAESPARVNAAVAGRKDPLEPAAKTGGKRYSKGFLQAIDHGLALRAEDRPQDIETWERELRTGKVAYRPERATGLAAAPTRLRSGAVPAFGRMGRLSFLLAVAAVFGAWFALPLLTRAAGVEAGGLALGPALYAAGAGLATGLATRLLVPSLAWRALPVAVGAWGAGFLLQTLLRDFAREISVAFAWPVTEVYFGASGIAGLAGGIGMVAAARLAWPPLRWWGMVLGTVCWALLWWAQPYIFFSLRVSFAGELGARGFAVLDGLLLGLAGAIGFLAFMALWQARRWPRWGKAAAD